MSELDLLAQRFETDSRRLRAVAYRLLGSQAEADDAVQEAWLRISRADPSEGENMSGWLTTVVARVSLNMLKSRASRHEELTDVAADVADATADPERETLLADSVGFALLIILDALTPAERLAFVLHDMFAVPFEEIAPVVDRSPAATRQLASRARRRVQQTDGPTRRRSRWASKPRFAGPTPWPASSPGGPRQRARPSSTAPSAWSGPMPAGRGSLSASPWKTAGSLP